MEWLGGVGLMTEKVASFTPGCFADSSDEVVGYALKIFMSSSDCVNDGQPITAPWAPSMAILPFPVIVAIAWHTFVRARRGRKL